MPDETNPKAPPAGATHRAIFITRDVPALGLSAGQVMPAPAPGQIIRGLSGDDCRPATQSEIAIAGLALEIPEA